MPRQGRALLKGAVRNVVVARTAPRHLPVGDTQAELAAGYLRLSTSIPAQSAPDAAAVDAAPLVLLVAHGDPVTGDMATALERADYRAKIVAPDAAAISRALALCPDLVVLNLDACGTTGMGMLHRLHSLLPLLPVVVMSAHADETELVRGLAAGADDFLSWSISPIELVARVRAVLRRSLRLQPRQPVLQAGPLVVDARSRRVEIFGAETPVTETEFKLLVFLMRHPRQVLRREVLLQQVWGYTSGTRRPSPCTCDGCAQRWSPIPPIPPRFEPCGERDTCSTRRVLRGGRAPMSTSHGRCQVSPERHLAPAASPRSLSALSLVAGDQLARRTG